MPGRSPATLSLCDVGFEHQGGGEEATVVTRGLVMVFEASHVSVGVLMSHLLDQF